METKFWLEDVVYHRMDADHTPLLVTGIHIRPAGVLYSVTDSQSDFTYYEIELDSSPNWSIGQDES